MASVPRYEYGTHRLWSLLEGMPRALHRVELWCARDSRGSPGAVLHLHSAPTLVTCLAGVVRMLGGPKGVIDLHAGEALVIAPGVWHKHEVLRTGSAGCSQGFLAACSDLKVQDHRREFKSRIPVNPYRLLLDRIVRLGPSVEAAKARTAACIDLFEHLLTETIEPLEPWHPAMQRMIDVLWSRMHEPITTDDIVAASGLGRSQSYRLFSAQYGKSIKQSLLQMRLELAKELLVEGFAVGEVSLRCGFPNRANFTRSFGRAYGTAPQVTRSRKSRPG